VFRTEMVDFLCSGMMRGMRFDSLSHLVTVITEMDSQMTLNLSIDEMVFAVRKMENKIAA
jgi:hypothetical protein